MNYDRCSGSHSKPVNVGSLVAVGTALRAVRRTDPVRPHGRKYVRFDADAVKQALARGVGARLAALRCSFPCAAVAMTRPVLPAGGGVPGRLVR